MESVESNRPRVDIPFHRSVRGKLTLVVVGILLLTIVCLTALNYAYIGSNIRNEARYELELYGESLSAVLTRYIEMEQRLLHSFTVTGSVPDLLTASSVALAGGEELPQRIAAVIEEARRNNKEYTKILIADKAGIVRGSTDPSQVGQSVAGERIHIEGTQGPYVQFQNVDDVDQSLTISVPIADSSGEVVGVASAVVDASELSELVASSRAGHSSMQVRCAVRNEDNTVRYLFASGDFQVLHEQSSQLDEAMTHALEGNTGFLPNAIDYRGVKVLTAYRSLGESGWGLVTQIDQSDAFRSLGRVLVAVICFGIIFAFISGIAAATVVQSSLRPIRRLARATRRMTQGDYSTRTEIGTADELGELGRDFNTMSETVEQHTLTLEDRVQRRTAELEKSKEQLQSLVLALEHSAELMDRDLEQAEVIQRSLLPRNPPRVQGFSLSGMYIPGKSVGGDLYDVIRIDERHIGFVLADSTGHGVSAAMLTVLFKNRLDIIEQDDDAYRSEHPSPSASEALGLPVQSHSAIPVFTRVNEELKSDVVGTSMFVTALFCILDTHSHKFSVASAGHPPLLVLRASGEVEVVAPSSPALGLYSDAEFAEDSLVLEANDRVLMYTDGLFNLGGENRFSIEDVAAHLKEIPPGKGTLRKLLTRITGDMDSVDRDDLTMLLIDVRDGENDFEHLSASIYETKIAKEARRGQTPRIEYAEDATSLYLTYHGRITWIHGQSLSETVRKSASTGKRVLVDLSDCEYLDSTMLGTLHEVAELCESLGNTLHIQNVGRELHDTFVELGMRDVLSRINGIVVQVPEERQQLVVGGFDTLTQQKLLLRAHEALASISESNQSEFKDVIEELREEIVNAK